MADTPTIIVVGAAGNLGPTWVISCLEMNYSVVAVGLDLSNSLDLIELSRKYDQLALVESDITASDWVEKLRSLFRGKNCVGLVFNAGIDSRPGEGRPSLSEYGVDHFKEVFEVNFFAALQTLGIAAEQFRVNGGGSIVVIGSAYADQIPNSSLYGHFNDGRGQVKSPAYTSSKSALLAVMKYFAAEYAAYGVRINMLSPGGVEGNQDAIFKTKFKQSVPIKRLGQVSELKSTMQWMIDPENTYLIGQNIRINGGFDLW